MSNVPKIWFRFSAESFLLVGSRSVIIEVKELYNCLLIVFVTPSSLRPVVLQESRESQELQESEKPRGRQRREVKEIRETREGQLPSSAPPFLLVVLPLAQPNRLNNPIQQSAYLLKRFSHFRINYTLFV